jgi:hypothetical protein
VYLQTIILKNSKNAYWVNQLNNDLQDVAINFIPCFQVGEAAKNIQQEDYIRETNCKGLLCRKNGSFSISSDGVIWPCCSPYITETGLSLANIKEGISVLDTLDILRRNIILYSLRNFGFDYFIDIAINKLKIDIPQKVITL